MLRRTLKMAFWVSYDHLGKLLLINLLCILVLALPGGLAFAALTTGGPAVALVIGLPLIVITVGVLLPALAAGIVYLAKELIERRDGSVGMFVTGLRRFALRAMGVGLAYAMAVICLITSVWFYAQRLGESMPWLGYGLSAIALWALVFAGLSALLAIPALVQKNGGVWATIRLSGLLVLDNPFFCMGLALHAALIGALSLAPPVLVLFSVAPLVVLLSSAYEMLSRKYALREAKAAGDDAEPLLDEEDDYLSRGFRDFLFPWKG